MKVFYKIEEEKLREEVKEALIDARVTKHCGTPPPDGLEKALVAKWTELKGRRSKE